MPVTHQILEQMNPKQKEAVMQTEGPLLIMAGAGSGKTRVLTHRIAYLIEERQVNPWNILAITFTNKAAQEMKERVDALIPEGGKDVNVSTFHALCVRILRREAEAIGYSQSFTIADTSAQKTLIKQVLKKLNISEKSFNPNYVLSRISQAKNELLNEQSFSEQAANYFDQQISKIYDLYQKELRLAESMDFDDLIMQTVRLFNEHPDILSFYQNRYHYIHVDEYQDTNHAQYQLVKLLAARFKNVCVVGDADQSIYGWRGADMSNILDFEKDYPGARTIFLEQNYRSTQTILNAANAVIRNNLNRREKKLWTDNQEGAKIIRYRAGSEYDEAEFVASKISELKQERPELSYGDFAVLYRTNAMSRVVEEILVSRQIPYQMVGGTGFYDRKEIRDLLAYLTLIVNPTDNMSFARVVNEPKRGIGAVTIERLTAAADERGLSLYEAAETATSTNIATRAAGKLEEFARMIADFQKMSDYLSMTELTETVLERTGYLEMLRAERTLEAESRLENIEEFYSVTQNYDQQKRPEASLLDFLTELSLLAPADRIDPTQGEVTLMTMHAAKGLEFPYVFIVGMEEGVFPNERLDSSEEDLEEERRLAYVGITRAEKQLFLTHTTNRTLYGRTKYHQPSRFFEEIGSEYLEEVGDSLPFGGRSGRIATPGFNKRPIRQAPAMTAKHQPQNDPAAEDWTPGDKVKHPKWGEGTVVQVSGTEVDTQVDVAFNTVGIKKLLVAFAPIEKI